MFGIVYGLLVLAVFYLNFEGIRHYTLAQVYQNKPLPEVQPISPKATATYVNAPSDQEVHEKLLSLFEKKELYLVSKLGLKDLADELGESTHTISRVLNSIEQKSFYEFVNIHRVEHLKRLLEDPQNRAFTILSMGLDSGFNSKASINRIFKNITGLTPKQYLDQTSQPIA